MPTYVIDSIGRLRNSVVIQQQVVSGSIRTFTTFATVFAAIIPMSGSEGPNAHLGAPYQAMYRVRIRYLKGVRPKMRLLFQPDSNDPATRVLEIDTVLDDPDERHHFMDMSCREVAA